MKLPALSRATALVLSVASCSMAPGSGPTASPQVHPSRPPTATTAPTVAAEAGETATPSGPAEPPKGYLSSGGTPTEGLPGSYCWEGTCADMPEVPDKEMLPTVEAQADGQLEFSLSDTATFLTWAATYGDRSGQLSLLDQGGEPFDPDAMPEQSPVPLSSVTFAAPPTGDWIVETTVRFPGGDLSYAWHVTID